MTDSDQSRLTDEESERLEQLMHTPHEDLSDAEITSKIKLSLKRRLDYPEWVMVFEYTAPNGRRADAIAVNTTSSRNFKLAGFEFKASRSDWLNEKRDGLKSEHFVKLCDEWYVVAGGTDIVKESELPDGWGLFEMKPNSEQLWLLEESDLTEYQQGEPDRRFWAKFLKKTVGGNANYTKQDLEEARKRGYEEAVDQGVERRVDREIRRLEDDAENWRTLEEAGFDFIYYLDEDEIEHLKRAYRLLKGVYGGRYPTLQTAVSTLEDQVERGADEMLEAVSELEDGLQDLQDVIDADSELLAADADGDERQPDAATTQEDSQ